VVDRAIDVGLGAIRNMLAKDQRGTFRDLEPRGINRFQCIRFFIPVEVLVYDSDARLYDLVPKLRKSSND